MSRFISPEELVQQFAVSHSMHPMSPALINAVGSGKVNESKVTGALAGMKSYAESLCKKYEKYLGDMKEGSMKRTAALMMENWHRATAYLDEETKAGSIANWDKNAFPLIRTILPNLATEAAFTLQPMVGPTSQIFTFMPVYGTTTGKVTAGTPLFGETIDPYYGNSVIDEEQVGLGDGATTTTTATLDYTPVLAGSVSITDGPQIVTDDGSGNLSGDGTGTVDYTTGAVSITWTIAPTSGNAITANYQVNNETNEAGIPQIDYQLTATTVTARRKAIRFRYSLIAEFSLKSQYGLEGVAELNAATGAEIAYGIDIENFTIVVKNAVDKRADADFIFDEKVPSGVSYTEHKFTLIDYMIKGSTQVAKQSGRVAANWALADETFTNILESIGAPRFVKQPGINAARGVQIIGTLDDRWTIFRILNPADIKLNAREFVLGSKQSEFLYAGYIFAPWILAFETPLTILDDMAGRKAIGSLYAHKLINNKYYLKMKTVKTT